MQVSLRELRDTDLPLLLAWAHIKEIWTYMPTSRSSENLTWERHFSWWKSRKDRVDWIIEPVGFQRPVGVIHLAGLSKPFPEVGLYIGEVGLWGQDIGEQSLKMVMAEASAMGIIILVAVMLKENQRSVSLFMKLGFKDIGEARNGQRRYERTFGRPEVPVFISQARDRRIPQPVPT